MKSKKIFLSVFNGSFETYNRYSGVADEEQKKKSQVILSVVLKLTLDILELQMKSKKNCFNVSFLSNLVGGAIAFLVFLKETI